MIFVIWYFLRECKVLIKITIPYVANRSGTTISNRIGFVVFLRNTMKEIIE